MKTSERTITPEHPLNQLLLKAEQCSALKDLESLLAPQIGKIYRETAGRRQQKTSEAAAAAKIVPYLESLKRHLVAISAVQAIRVNEVELKEGRDLLSRREAEIACRLLQGSTPAGIARQFSLRIATVNRHIANIYKKLNISSRRELFRLVPAVAAKKQRT